MSIFNQRNQFYFDHEAVRLWASSMDLRPYLEPTGWVLLIVGTDEWELAEYGIAYSPESAQIHAEGAKSRYIRKRYYQNRYERELNHTERKELKRRVASEGWSIKTYPVICTVEVSPLRVKVRSRASQLATRDAERLHKLRTTRRMTVARKAR